MLPEETVAAPLKVKLALTPRGAASQLGATMWTLGLLSVRAKGAPQFRTSTSALKAAISAAVPARDG